MAIDYVDYGTAGSYGPGGFMALLAGMLLVMLLVGLIVYVYTSIALMTIAKRTKTENSWLAWIPIANIYLMTQIAGVPGWWTLSILLFIIPFIGPIAFAVIFCYLWWKIAEARKMPGWLGALMWIPLVNLIIMGVLAWCDK